MAQTSPNPLRAGLREERTPEPCAMVIFGASGDLTRRKLLPAIYSLARDRLLPESFAVVGYARRPYDDESFTQRVREGCDKYARRRPVEEELWDSFGQAISYVQGSFDEEAGYQRLREHLEGLDQERGIRGNRVFYLATPPSAFATILKHLRQQGLLDDGDGKGFSRVIIEKPFGHDLESARELNQAVSQYLREDQTYRIDHYLGKETVQNIMVFRFANGIFEPLWNRQHIDHVQLTVAENIGMEGRGKFFEEAGILRDIIQNHLFQILSLMAMEPPVSLDANAIRDEKVKLLRALRPVDPESFNQEVIRAQYVEGSVGGAQADAYRQEPGVAQDSQTETYAAMKLHIDNWRWAGVPFYLRAGKRLPKKVAEFAIHFKHAPQTLFQDVLPGGTSSNVLVVRVQPDEGISLTFDSKVPGPSMQIHPLNMEFRYGSAFGTAPPEAYERLLLDAMLGDSTLFIRDDEIELAWKWCDQLLHRWAQDPEVPLHKYSAGSWGPEAADELLHRDGRRWRRP
jgi:glucose-6-phosphate 1-dehydrogenase